MPVPASGYQALALHWPCPASRAAVLRGETPTSESVLSRTRFYLVFVAISSLMSLCVEGICGRSPLVQSTPSGEAPPALPGRTRLNVDLLQRKPWQRPKEGGTVCAWGRTPSWTARAGTGSLSALHRVQWQR